MLESLKPTQKARVMDLVEAAGIDISDWKNVKGGEKNAATNPKYCYEWSFIQPSKVVVLNLWHSDMEEVDGKIIHRMNFRDRAFRQYKPNWKTRDMKLDNAIKTALISKIPIRVILLDGKKRDTYNPDSEPSSVEYRYLDSIPWSVTIYNQETGECVLTRGAGYIDQFILQESEKAPEKRTVTNSAFVRDYRVREHALRRSNGMCEWCGKYGFRMANGALYLETHHIIPLSENGMDSPQNVIALCPNHHREAHYGENRAEIRQRLLKLIA